MTLRFKLLATVALAVVVAAGGATLAASWQALDREHELLHQAGASLAGAVATSASAWFEMGAPLPGAEEALEASLQRTVQRAGLARAWVVDREGSVIACVDPRALGCPPGMPGSFRSVHTPFEAVEDVFSPDAIESAAPLVWGDSVVGAVRVTFGPEVPLRHLRKVGAVGAIFAIIWLLAALGLAAFMIRRVTRPLTRLVDATEALGRDDASITPLEAGDDADAEVLELVHAFNRLSGRLDERRRENERIIESLEDRVAEATRDILRADRLATLGGIAAGFAHELGNSLHVVNGYASVVRRDLPEVHQNHRDVVAIQSEVGRAAALLERFLVFARARSARKDLQPLQPVVEEVVQLLSPPAATSNVALSLHSDPSLPLLEFDAQLIRQALINLCFNAIQAMQPGGGELMVKTWQENGHVGIDVEDTGPGVPEEITDRIFEPFFTSKANGTGLGLAIVRHAVEAHSGSIEVFCPGHPGAGFRMRLPRGEKAA